MNSDCQHNPPISIVTPNREVFNKRLIPRGVRGFAAGPLNVRKGFAFPIELNLMMRLRLRSEA
jgi:hypothetical protein